MSATVSVKAPLSIAAVGLATHLILSKFFNGLHPVIDKLLLSSAVSLIAIVLLLQILDYGEAVLFRVERILLRAIRMWSRVARSIQKMKRINTSQAVFTDDYLVVRNIGFEPSSGRLKLAIDEKREGVGFYYITATFDSGNATRIDYDGGNLRRNKQPIVQTGKPNDPVKEIKVVRVRD